MAKLLSVFAYGYTLFIVAASLGKFAINIFPQRVDHSDKIGHFMAYSVFAFIWASFLFKAKGIKFNKSIFFSFLWSALFGVLMEFCQWIFTSYRQFDYYDMLANTAGSIIGLLFFYIYFEFIQKKWA